MKVLYLTLALCACGSHPSGDSSSSSSSQTATEHQAATQEASFTGARLVDSMNDMGVCDAFKLRQLIYVVEEAQFYYCAKSDEWLAIDLKGAKGDTGVQGAAGRDGRDGANGKDGRDGRDGVQGAKGDSGTDGENASNLVWRHPVSDAKWFLGHSFNYAGLFFAGSKTQLCPSGSHVPNSDEFKDAVNAGIWNQIGATIKADTRADSRIILDQVGNANAYELKLGDADAVVTNYNNNTVTVTKYVYSVCVVN